jgi:hypothetical protein
VFDPQRVDVTLADHVLGVLRKDDRFICHSPVSGPVLAKRGATGAPFALPQDASQVMRLENWTVVARAR